MTILYVLAAILMFGILITVHEAGHFFAARMFKIPVKEFAIGFGPKLLQWKRKKHETEFFLRAIPLGGYCAFYGEDDTTGAYQDDPRAFQKHSAIKRLLTILMGPVMNLLLAFLVAILFYTISGIPVPNGAPITIVQSVNQDGAAMRGGMMSGDVIVSIDGQEISDNLSEVLAQHAGIDQPSRQVVVARQVEGDKQQVNLQITPVHDPVEGRNMIGIMMSVVQPMEMVPGSFSQVLSEAASLSVRAARSIIDAIKGLFTQGSGLNEVSGVVGITRLIVDEISRTHLTGYLYLMIIISINLGLMNLLPIPGLDGSRILFLVVEAIRGKPIKKEGYVHAAGMILLFALMAFITLRDIVRLF